MMSLNFAILKYFEQVKEACVDDITNALKREYYGFKNLEKRDVISILMTAEASGSIERTRFQLDENGKTKIYYSAYEEDEASLIF